MIENLFGSKTRVKLLHLFLTNPSRSFYVREITRKINEQINSVRRELSNLLTIGVIRSDTSGNKLYYEANQTYRHYKALRSMFTDSATKKDKVVAKTDSDLGTRLSKAGSIELAILTGVFVRQPNIPVDILIVGNVNRNELQKIIAEVEAEEGKEIRYTVFTREEFDYRLDLGDRFVTNVLESKKSVITGEDPKLATKKEKK